MTRSRFVFGVGFIALGTVLLLGQLDVLDAGDVISTWWPTLLLLVGLSQLVTEPRNTLSGGLWLLVGTILLLWRLEVIAGIGIVWPVLLVLFGLWLMFRWPRSGGSTAALEGEIVTIFNDRDVHAAPGPLGRHAFTTVFGDLDVDLRSTHLDGEASLEVITVFGDVDIEIPDTWRVSVSGPEIFGDVSIKHDRSQLLPPDAPHLRVRTTTVFGDLLVRAHPVVTN